MPVSGSLPQNMTRENSCCFTGHRSIPSECIEEIKKETERTVRILIENGYRYFICGGALGFDTLAAQVVTALAEELDIELILALPCLNQTERWLGMKNGEDSIREYQRIKGLAAGVCYIRDLYEDGCMKERNQFMVDHTSFCIAYYNGNPRSGAGQTFRMAKKAGLGLYNLYNREVSEGETSDEPG